MFIIELTYIAPLDEIDAAMPAHMAYLKKYYSKKIFLMSGRKQPRKGGVIIALGDDKNSIKEIAREDPFYKNKLSKFKIIEFNASQSQKGLSAFLK